MKTKLFRIGVVISSATLVLLMLDISSKVNAKEGPIIINNADTLVLADLNAQCDSLAAGTNGKAEYDELLRTLCIYRSFEVIDVSEAAHFNNTANVSYAQSLIHDFNKWISSDCHGTFNTIEYEMSRMSRLPGSDNMLFDYIQAFQAYRIALSVPSRVNSFLNSEYSESTFLNLKNSIDHYCNNEKIQGCDIVQQAKQYKGKLMDFKDFALRYRDLKDKYFDDEYSRFNNASSKDLFFRAFKTVNYPRYQIKIDSLRIYSY